jgi:hypothetical protein
MEMWFLSRMMKVLWMARISNDAILKQAVKERRSFIEVRIYRACIKKRTYSKYINNHVEG